MRAVSKGGCRVRKPFHTWKLRNFRREPIFFVRRVQKRKYADRWRVRTSRNYGDLWPVAWEDGGTGDR